MLKARSLDTTPYYENPGHVYVKQRCSYFIGICQFRVSKYLPHAHDATDTEYWMRDFNARINMKTSWTRYRNQARVDPVWWGSRGLDSLDNIGEFRPSSEIHGIYLHHIWLLKNCMIYNGSKSSRYLVTWRPSGNYVLRRLV